MPTLLHPPPSLFYIALALNAPCQSSLAGQNLELDVFPLHYILADTQDILKYAPPGTDQACTLHNNIVLTCNNQLLIGVCWWERGGDRVIPLVVGGKLASRASCKARGEYLYSKQCYSRNVEQHTTIGEGGIMSLTNNVVFRGKFADNNKTTQT